MGKTIKQIAADLGVSKQAVWQRVKRSEELSAILESHAETVNGTIYVDAILEQCIKGLYPDRSAPAEDSSTGASTSAQSVDETTVNVDETTVNVDVNALVETLQNTVDALKQQLMEKDTQIAGLTAALSNAQQVQQQLSAAMATSQETQKQLSDALAAAQALHAGTIQMQQQQAQQTQPEPPQDAPVVDAAEPEQAPAEEEIPEKQETQVVAPELEGKKGGAMVYERKKRGFWAKLFKK